MGEKTKVQLQNENEALKRKLAEKPETNNATILAENDELKAKIANLALQKGIIDIKVDAEIEETTFIYKAIYPRKLKVLKGLVHNVSDGMGGYTREEIRGAVYVKFEGSQHGAYFTLNKKVAEQKGLTVSEYKYHIERNSQFGVDIKLLTSSKNEEDIKKFVSKLRPDTVPLVSGVTGV